MKRLFTFLALCCLVVTGAWAQLADGIYTIKCPNAEGSYTNRGTLAYKPGNDQLVFLAEVGGLSTDKTNATGKTCAEANVCGYWGIKNYNGHTWIYNLGNGKTINKPTNNNGASSWADIAADNYVSIESSTAKTGQFWIKGNYTSTAYLSASAWWAADQNTGGVRWYSSPTDAGDNFSITAVESTLSASLQTQYATTIAAAEAAIKSTMLRPTYVNSSDSRATNNSEHANKLVDDSGTSTKWGMSYSTGDKPWIVVQADNTILKGYDLYNGNDTNGQPGRRWKNWTVEGSNDNTNWTTIATVTNANMNTTNYGKNSYSTESNDQQYNYYRFTITANEGGSMIQMSDLQLKVIVNPTTYTVLSAGMPSGVTVQIKGEVVEQVNAWTEGNEYLSLTDNLSKSDVLVSDLGNGYICNISVDNGNHQIWINFTQIFVPANDESEVSTATKYFFKDASGRYPYVDGSDIKHTTDRKQASQYVLINGATTGQYYIYDITNSKYIYANGIGDGGYQTSQANSKVQMTSNKADASCWTFTEGICVLPAAGGNSGWNFTGGNGKVLNLYQTTDSNSKWQIIDSTVGSLACAVTMFSKPGAEYMHKLIPEAGVTVESITLNGSLTGLTLEDGRSTVGNKYKYVHGNAPSTPGEYTYDVNLSDGTKAKVSLTVSDFLQAPTPGMVWVSWNWLKNTIDATNLSDMADGLVAKGLKDVGFNTIVIDDAWGTGADKAHLTWNTQKFPNGMKSFVDGINSKGIKVGIYADAGTMTCGGFQPGTYGYEAEHLAMFDSWGIDFLKYDFCRNEADAKTSYTRMGNEIKKLNAKREAAGQAPPFVFNACEWGHNEPWKWVAEAGSSMWRATDDAREDWIGNTTLTGVLAGADEVRDLWMYAGVNRFNDLDMMCIGLHGLGSPSNHTVSWGKDGGRLPNPFTDEQARSQMSLWSMLASPLSLSCDVRTTPKNECNGNLLNDPLITETDLAILKNKDIIAIDQDPLGQQAEYLPLLGTNSSDYSDTGCDVYVKDLVGGDIALAILNRASTGMDAKTIDLEQIYLKAGTTYNVKNVWTKEVTTATGTLTTDAFAAYETKVYIISEEPFEEEAVTFVTTSTSDSKTYYTIQNVRTMGENNGANPAYVTAPSAGACMTQASTVTDNAVWYFEDATADVTDVDLTLYQPVYIRNLNYEGYLSCPRNNNAANASFTTTDTKQIFYLSQWTNAENPNGYLCVTTEPRTTAQNTATERIAWADKNDDGQYINYYVTQDGGTSFLLKEYTPTTITYYITITGVPEGKTAELSYKGSVCGEQLETSDNIKKEDFSVTQIPGYNSAIYIDGDQINVIYTLENHIIEALDIVGMPEDYDRGIIVNGQRYLNTQVSNVTPLVISGALDYEALPVPGYATTVELYQTTIAGQSVSGIRVKYVAQKPLAYTSATSYYVNIKSADGYLYNDRENDTKTLSNSASSTNNNYVWRVDVAEDGTMTITNGQGSHYTNESGSEKATFTAEEIAALGWTFEPVSFKYVTKILVVNEEGQGYVTLNNNRAYNNGFLMSDDINFNGLGYGDLSDNTIAQRVGAGFEYAQKSVRPVVRLTYFTQEDVDENEPKMLDRMVFWYNHIGKVGYPTGETLCLAYDEDYKAYYPNGENEYCENFILDFWQPLEFYMYMGFVPTTSDYLKILSVFDKVSTENNIVLPIVGEGYRISVRTKSGEHKYLIAGGKLTTDVSKASVFVLSKDEDQFFFASNDNTNLNYLTSEGEKKTAYSASSCAFTPFQMSLVEQDFTEDGDVTANPSERVGTFSLTLEGGTITLDDEDNWSLSDNLRMNATYTSAFELEDVEYPYNKPKLAVGNPDEHEGSYASIWLPYPMMFPDGVEVYRATDVENDGILILKQVNSDTMVAAGGYIIRDPNKSTSMTVLPAPAAPDDVTPCEDNAFVGSTEDPLNVEVDGSWNAFAAKHEGTAYVLAKKNNVIGYYKYNDAENRLPKGKAIWFSKYSSDANCMQFSFDDIVSAIEALHGNTGDNEIFDLQGRRLDKAEKGQVSVINGKKVMFK